MQAGSRLSRHRDRGGLLSLPPFQGRLHPDYNFPALRESLIKLDTRLDEPGVEFLGSSRNRIAVIPLPAPGGTTADYVVKEFCPRGIDQLKSLFQTSKAFRAWRGGWDLMDLGFDTPLPIAYLEKRRGKLLERALFIALSVPDVCEVRSLLRTLEGEPLEALVRDLAVLARRCHDSGILHRDLSDGNILVRRRDSEPSRFVIVDTNRIRRRSAVRRVAGVKNLIRLGIPPHLQPGFLKTYLEPRPKSRRLWLWYRVNKTVFSGYMGLKNRLRIRRLVRKLGIQ